MASPICSSLATAFEEESQYSSFEWTVNIALNYLLLLGGERRHYNGAHERGGTKGDVGSFG